MSRQTILSYDTYEEMLKAVFELNSQGWHFITDYINFEITINL